ncbi:uncharacterized protein LOC133930598 isoform X1 [Phragmites australis]|uniref:uncharacterized protein LOC133930598 isoform X1 n=1 Tax=Phragmites australis TaxID=29695 RepID=UPI002D76F5DB|nr:uncharacterized protein LOC133930598 isoform X1 [Phragmites australis]
MARPSQDSRWPRASARWGTVAAAHRAWLSAHTRQGTAAAATQRVRSRGGAWCWQRVGRGSAARHEGLSGESSQGASHDPSTICLLHGQHRDSLEAGAQTLQETALLFHPKKQAEGTMMLAKGQGADGVPS